MTTRTEYHHTHDYTVDQNRNISTPITTRLCRLLHDCVVILLLPHSRVVIRVLIFLFWWTVWGAGGRTALFGGGARQDLVEEHVVRAHERLPRARI